MNRYDPARIEPKWQKIWANDARYKAPDASDKPKYYVSGMFPYPSGAGMHTGHFFEHSIVDAVARFRRSLGHNVMYPMGWDSFGLPAENYAIKTGKAPAVTTLENIASFKNQLTRVGASIDWSREINTTDPEYYKWTQWIFTQLYERDLAYQKEANQWWCPHDLTVLANEQVESGKCWRCGNEVVKKSMKQWFFKITDYADALLEEIPDLDWPEKIKSAQTNWIGKSKGAEVQFAVDGTDDVITVFTTRPDTLFGATFLVLAPENSLAIRLATEEKRKDVEKYIAEAIKKSEIERQSDGKDKTGVATGSYAINPISGTKIPIWIADYVLGGYGTGAIMAVPAHDERDHDFAMKFNLDIIPVVARDFGEPLENAVEVTGSVVIAYDKAADKWLGFKTDNGLWLSGGGSEADETFEQTAVRELAEETGFSEYEDIVTLGEPVYSYYFNDVKKVNKRSFGQGFLFYVDPKKQGDAARETHETYEQGWYSYDELVAGIKQLGGGVEHWLEMLARAKSVVEGTYENECFHGDGILVNSGAFSGTPSAESRELIVQHLQREGKAQEKVNYKMRDWLISRQRYWGAPIPIIHCEKDGAVAVPEKDLPVLLPEVVDYEPRGDGKSVLAAQTEWVNTTCPSCGGPAKRETDTMDGYACSSWYLLRFTDPNNAQQAWDPAKAGYWSPIDMYVGGDHAVAHLLYVRFWSHVFYDMGLVPAKEPVKKLVYHGLIQAEDGRKMSKSLGNVVDPLEVIDQGYGADALRTFELFLGPINENSSWSSRGIAGVYRFLNRYWTLIQEYQESDKTTQTDARKLMSITHTTIRKVTDDMQRLSFNTAIAALMEYVNELYKLKVDGFSSEWQESLEALVKMTQPLTPHMSADLWQQLGHDTQLDFESWPQYDDSKIVSDGLTLAVQINGKVRAEIMVSNDASRETIEAAALSHDRIREFLGGKDAKRIIYVPGRLVNIVL